MKNENCGKKKYAKSVKNRADAEKQADINKNNYNTNLEYYMSEAEKMKIINSMIDKFLHNTLENYLISEFEAGDIRFMINDYLSNSNQIIPDYYIPAEDETIDDL